MRTHPRSRRASGRADPAVEHGTHTLRVWPGTIVGRFGDDVFVELGPRMQGVISARAFEVEPRTGASLGFTLRGQEEGLWILARGPSAGTPSWERTEVGHIVQGRAVRTTHGGLEVKVGALHAFLPKSHTGLQRDEDPAQLVGRTFPCEVIEVDRERERIVVSRKRVERRERASQHARAVASLRPGEVVSARVVRLEPYGAFVRFGRGIEGLIHVSNLAYTRTEHPAQVLTLGQFVRAKVLYVREKGLRVALGLKQCQPSPWNDFVARHAEGEVVPGRATRVLEYGAFVALAPGIEGLLHRSELGLAPHLAVRTQVHAGQALSVRLLRLDHARERIALSLLRPDGSRLEPDEAELTRAAYEGAGAAATDVGVRASLGALLRRALPERAPLDG
jgi:ribosomal protein S1